MTLQCPPPCRSSLTTVLSPSESQSRSPYAVRRVIWTNNKPNGVTSPISLREDDDGKESHNADGKESHNADGEVSRNADGSSPDPIETGSMTSLYQNPTPMSTMSSVRVSDHSSEDEFSSSRKQIWYENMRLRYNIGNNKPNRVTSPISSSEDDDGSSPDLKETGSVAALWAIFGVINQAWEC